MPDYRDLREEAYAANVRLPELGLVLFTFGNASAVDRERGVFAIKPSGVAYDELRVEDMVVCDFDGEVVDGELRPSSDTRTHAVLYREWSGIGGVVHTHSTYATAWAQALRDIPIFGTTHADHLTVDVPCARPMSEEYIRGDYERQTGHQIVDCLRERELDYAETHMALVGSHAPFTWGKTAAEAVYHSAVCEELARMAALTLQINADADRLNDALRRKHYERKHGANAYYGQ